MNWTGGHLSRHSHNGGTLTARQKQHFAKVKNNLRSGQRQKSPINWMVETNGSDPRPSPAVQTGSKESQSRSETQPMANPHKGYQRSSNHSRQRYDAQYKSQSVERQQRSNVNSSRGRSPRRNRVSSDDLYNATPLPGENEKKRQRSVSTSIEGGGGGPEEECMVV